MHACGFDLYNWTFCCRNFYIPFNRNMADEEIAHRCESSYKHHWETNPEEGGDGERRKEGMGRGGRRGRGEEEEEEGGDGERRKKGGGGGEMRSYNGELIFYYFVTMT